MSATALVISVVLVTSAALVSPAAFVSVAAMRSRAPLLTACERRTCRSRAQEQRRESLGSLAPLAALLTTLRMACATLSTLRLRVTSLPHGAPVPSSSSQRNVAFEMRESQIIQRGRRLSQLHGECCRRLRFGAAGCAEEVP